VEKFRGGGVFLMRRWNARNSMYWRGGAVSLDLGGCGMGGVGLDLTIVR